MYLFDLILKFLTHSYKIHVQLCYNSKTVIMFTPKKMVTDGLAMGPKRRYEIEFINISEKYKIN